MDRNQKYIIIKNICYTKEKYAKLPTQNRGTGFDFSSVILTFVDCSSNVFSLGSTTECSCTYVHVLVTPMICRKFHSSEHA